MTGRGVRGVALASALLVACSSTRDCSTIGCLPTVTITLPGDRADLPAGSLTVCIDEECHDVPLADVPVGASPVASLDVPGAEPGQVVSAVLVLPDGDEFRADATLEEVRPNGAGCSPVCTQVEVSLEPA